MKAKSLTLAALGFMLCTLIQTGQAQVGRGKFGFGVSVDGNMLQSDWKTNDPGFGLAANISYSLGHNWGLVSSLGFDTFNGKNSANETVLSTALFGNLAISYDFLRDKPINPFLYVGGSVVFFDPRVENGLARLTGRDRPWDLAVVGGIGFDYYISESWSLIVAADASMMATDWMDGYGGGGNDVMQRVSIGIRYYLFDRSAVEKIVKTVE